MFLLSSCGTPLDSLFMAVSFSSSPQQQCGSSLCGDCTMSCHAWKKCYLLSAVALAVKVMCLCVFCVHLVEMMGTLISTSGSTE